MGRRQRSVAASTPPDVPGAALRAETGMPGPQTRSLGNCWLAEPGNRKKVPLTREQDPPVRAVADWITMAPTALTKANIIDACEGARYAGCRRTSSTSTKSTGRTATSQPSAPGGSTAAERPTVPITEQVDTMQTLIQRGKGSVVTACPAKPPGG